MGLAFIYIAEEDVPLHKSIYKRKSILNLNLLALQTQTGLTGVDAH